MFRYVFPPAGPDLKYGNLISKAGDNSFSQTLYWNGLGLIDSVTTNGVTVHFRYDAFGRRVTRTVAGAVTQFVWNGDDVMLELDGSGNISRQFTYWGIDAPHSLYMNGETYYFLHDEVGQNVAGLVRRSDNTLVANYDYGAFGSLRPGGVDDLTPILEPVIRTDRRG